MKYRIDGVLQHAMQPIAKEWHSTVISRIKVLSDLDIAERRVPQDGRFRVKYKGRFIDLRVSIMPASHGEDAVLRVLDKETIIRKISKFEPGCSGLLPGRNAPLPKVYPRTLRNGAGDRADGVGKNHYAVRGNQRNQV